jgi:hypothetical protein
LLLQPLRCRQGLRYPQFEEGGDSARKEGLSNGQGELQNLFEELSFVHDSIMSAICGQSKKGDNSGAASTASDYSRLSTGSEAAMPYLQGGIGT